MFTHFLSRRMGIITGLLLGIWRVLLLNYPFNIFLIVVSFVLMWQLCVADLKVFCLVRICNNYLRNG